MDADEEGCFSFIWTIQNYDVCFRNNKDACYTSPTFELDENSCEKWSFKLSPKRYFRHDNIEMELQRFMAGKSRDFKLDILVGDVKGSFKDLYNNEWSFNSESKTTAFIKLILNQEVLETYPKNDSLIIKCRIRQLESEVLKTRTCYARTIIGAHRIVHFCTLSGFEEFENGTQIKKNVIILSKFPIFTMDLSTTRETNAENKIVIKIKPVNPIKKLYSTCEISLINTDKKIAHSVKDQCDFENSSPEQVWTFPFIQLSKVLGNKKLYLPNGVMHLRCEFVVSLGVKYNEVERTEGGMENTLQLEGGDQTTDSESLKDNLQQFYADGNFSDVTIRVPGKEFPVHKTILCARSKVFRAMFEHDTKENQTGVVEIVDVDENTVFKLLLFMYTDTVGEDLEFETASSLYFAADKYGIVALKKKCSDFLKDNFTLTNICDVLVLADMHEDQELKSTAQEFIFEHSAEIMKSEEWTKLMKNNLQLASDTMRLFIQNLKI